MNIARIQLKVLSHLEAATKGVLVGPVAGITGGGSDDFVCGRCGTVIAKSSSESHLKRLLNAAFKCNACNAVNAI